MIYIDTVGLFAFCTIPIDWDNTLVNHYCESIVMQKDKHGQVIPTQVCVFTEGTIIGINLTALSLDTLNLSSLKCL